MKEVIIKIDLSDLEKSIIERLDRIESKLDDITIPSPEPLPEPVPNPPSNAQIFQNWESTVEAGGVIELQDGVTYLIPTYKRANITKDLTITCKGKAKIIFGKDNYNQWTETGESQIIFFLGRWNNHIKIENVDLFTGKLLDQVQPFYRTLFQNTPEKDQTGTIELINSNTNLNYGLLYSGSQDQYLTCKAINVNFEGIIFQELKANNGGGILSYQRNCNLKQIDPVTSFKSKLKLTSQNSLQSYVPFVSIENMFIENGNSANIVFFDNMTFYLPKTNELGNTKTIRTIPQAGDVIDLVWSEPLFGTRYLGSNKYELQAGDIIDFNGKQYTITSKDRTMFPRFVNLGYLIDYAVNEQLPIKEGNVQVKVIKSKGFEAIGKEFDGYLIFKYNKNFQTNIAVDHGLDYMLYSNPFGVLSYNHVEITVDWENVVHDGFYRQSTSRNGFSNGYRMVNCTGFKDQFNPELPVNNIPNLPLH